ncbi:hypothetical protein [Agrobacterium pusense]|uniref:hypothetical protein n=1 Tax=Agrobacterium pusense TaxID=648995 RepID=UPI002FDE0A50
MKQLREKGDGAMRQIEAALGAVLVQRHHYRVEVAFIHARFRSSAHMRGGYEERRASSFGPDFEALDH